jgi:hypothetical protein
MNSEHSQMNRKVRPIFMMLSPSGYKIVPK